MQIVSHSFYGRKPIQIMPLFDIHLGAEACDEDKLRESIARVANTSRMYVIGGGDYAEYIAKSDKRFDVRSLASWMIDKDALADPALAQTDRIVSYLRPVAHKSLGMISGNHEASMSKYYERDILGEICRGIGRRDLMMGYEGWIILNFWANKSEAPPDHTIRIRVHHGYGGGRSEGAPMNAMQMMMLTHEADLVLMGHIHKRGVANPVMVEYIENGVPKYRIRKGMYCGTYLRTRIVGPSTYAAVAGYNVTLAVGSPILTVNPWVPDLDQRIVVSA